jgi:low affinity Fe/Cu permease
MEEIIKRIEAIEAKIEEHQKKMQEIEDMVVSFDTATGSYIDDIIAQYDSQFSDINDRLDKLK